jgi:acyl-CoA synthetase (NDP forming)
MTRLLHRLLKPKSIAVIGGKEAERVVDQAVAMGFDGDIWPVHPQKKQVCGLKCYQTVTELPCAPDAAYVAVNRHQTIDVVADLAGIGAGGAICYASGFSEADATGKDLQQALVEAAGDMAIIGPNCYGILNYAEGVVLWPDQHGGERLESGQSGVAIITQSSNIAINLTMQQRGLPLAYVLTIGNQAQTGLSELALELLDDARVSALGLHIEGFDSITGMEAVARKARRLKKPIVAMKIGRSSQAQKAALTHTASLSGQDNMADAFLKRIGTARVHSLSSLLETLKLLHVIGPLEGYAISSLSCSGGEAALMADAVVGRKVHFRQMSIEEKQPVEAALGPRVSVSNPLDYHTYIWGDCEGMETAFSAMLQVGFDLNCLIMDFPRPDRCSVQDWQGPVAAWVSAAQTTDAKACLIATLHENISEAQAKELCATGIAPLVGIDESLEAIEAAADIGQAWQHPVFTPITPVADLSGSQEQVLDEAQGKKLLSQFGVAIPAGSSFSTREALKVTVGNTGYPVVLKALGIAHKSEHNAVRLNLDDFEALDLAATELLSLNKTLYVEAMVQHPVLELLVGVVRDAQLGLVMTIATGGVMVEVFNDSQTLLLPFEECDVRHALRGLKSVVLFDGFRGRAAADFEATVKTIMQIMDFALAHRECLDELDINPLIVCEPGYGAIAADVLIKFGNRKNE